mmetsp:Transcript_31854/g.80553  ORF Transcript_31854/g.80553 Transcript_31854/m.80553 type:complete len:303 (+) Transcript_31854:666-1574(+)
MVSLRDVIRTRPGMGENLGQCVPQRIVHHLCICLIDGRRAFVGFAHAPGLHVAGAQGLRGQFPIGPEKFSLESVVHLFQHKTNSHSCVVGRHCKIAIPIVGPNANRHAYALLRNEIGALVTPPMQELFLQRVAIRIDRLIQRSWLRYLRIGTQQLLQLLFEIRVAASDDDTSTPAAIAQLEDHLRIPTLRLMPVKVVHDGGGQTSTVLASVGNLAWTQMAQLAVSEHIIHHLLIAHQRGTIDRVFDSEILFKFLLNWRSSPGELGKAAVSELKHLYPIRSTLGFLELQIANAEEHNRLEMTS